MICLLGVLDVLAVYFPSRYGLSHGIEFALQTRTIEFSSEALSFTMIPPSFRQFVLYIKPENCFQVALLLEHYSFEVKRLSSLDDAIALIRTMQTCDLYLLIRDLPAGEDVKASSPNMSLHDVVAALERSMITEALLKHDGNISRAARELKLTRRGLQLKLKRLSLKRMCAADTRESFNPPD